MDEFKGKLKLLTLYLLSKSKMHGYLVMKKLEELLGYKPYPGAIYPILGGLRREGLIRISEEREEGRRAKVYEITDKGEEFLKQRSEELRKALEMASCLRYFSEMGGRELMSVVKDVVRALPEMDREARAEVSSTIKAFVRDLRKILGR